MNAQAAPLLNSKPLEREDWLNLMGESIISDVLEPAIKSLGLDLPAPPVRYSVGFAPKSQGKELGCCFARNVSEDGHNEIFVTPLCDDSSQITATLVHELIHAFLDLQDGHKGRFKRIAQAAGLVGKMTATSAGDELQELIDILVDAIGPIPAAKIKMSAMPKGQTGRMLKVECEECSFIFRASRTQINRLAVDAPCPCCGGESLNLDA